MVYQVAVPAALRLLTAAAVATSCIGCLPGPDPEPQSSRRPGGGYLIDSFPPESPSPTADSTPGEQAVEAPSPADRPAPRTPEEAGSDVPAVATIDDPRGDVSASADPPPAYADLLGGTLTMAGDRSELRVRLAAVPPEAERSDRTMNVAAFFDLDGDGAIDLEAWANLADTGWFPAWFDNRSGRGWFGADSGVEVAAERDELVMRFGTGKLEGAVRYRWALASEWGRYEVISTPAAARDRAPDSGAAVFPGE